MKVVMLVDGSTENFEKLVDAIEDEDKNSKSVFISTEHCDEENEYRYLMRNIRFFSRSDGKIMLSKFSGRESIIKEIGDESPEMILSLSYNKSSKYYTEKPIDMFINLLNIIKEN